MIFLKSLKYLRCLRPTNSVVPFDKVFQIKFKPNYQQAHIKQLAYPFSFSHHINTHLCFKAKYSTSNQKSMKSQVDAKVSTMMNQAIQYIQRRQFVAARRLFEQIARSMEKDLGKKNKQYVSLMNSIAVTYQREGKFAQCKQHLLKCLVMLDDVPEDTNLEKAITKATIGQILFAQMKIQQAKLYLIESSQFLLSKNILSTQLIEVLYLLGAIFKNQNNLLQSLKYISKSLELIQVNFGKQCKQALPVLKVSASLYRQLKKAEEYEMTLKKILRIFQKIGYVDNQEHHNMLSLLVEYIVIQNKQLQNKQILDIVEKCYFLGKKLNKSDRVSQTHMILLTRCYYKNRLFQKALQMANKCLPFLQKPDPTYIFHRQNLLRIQSHCYKEAGKVQQAARSNESLLASLRENPSTQKYYYQALIQVLFALAEYHHLSGDKDNKFLALQMQAVKIYMENLHLNLQINAEYWAKIAKRLEVACLSTGDLETAKQFAAFSQKFKPEIK